MSYRIPDIPQELLQADDDDLLMIHQPAEAQAKRIKRKNIGALPIGGGLGQALVKRTDNDFDAEWADKAVSADAGNAAIISANDNKIFVPEPVTGGFKNKLINGDFRINQRAFDGNWAAITGGHFGYDRWHANVTPPTQIIQKVEHGNLKPGQTYTLSWGSPTDGAQHGAGWLGGDNVYHHGLTSPVTFVYVAGATQPRAYIPVDCTWAQLEEGDKATSFEKRFIGTEMAMCQRYFYRSNRNNVHHGVIWAGDILNRYKFNVTWFPVTMRTTPTFTEMGSEFRDNIGADVSALLSRDSFSYRATVAAVGAARIFNGDYWFEAEI